MMTSVWQRNRPVHPRKLSSRLDFSIRALWRSGWDTASIADHINATATDAKVGEEDVYNVLDRALGRSESVIVKTT